MPLAAIKHVASFTSEVKPHVADNVLNDSKHKTWRGEAGKPQHVIVLQLEKACQITGIDLANYGAAFAEILVGRSGSGDTEYKTLMPVTKLMSPSESKDWINIQAVFMFGDDKFDKATRKHRWDSVRVVLRQPYCKTEEYGLTFLKIHVASTDASQSGRSSTGLSGAATTASSAASGGASPSAPRTLGLFKLRREPTTSLSAGGLFFKRKSDTGDTATAALKEATRKHEEEKVRRATEAQTRPTQPLPRTTDAAAASSARKAPAPSSPSRAATTAATMNSKRTPTTPATPRHPASKPTPAPKAKPTAAERTKPAAAATAATAAAKPSSTAAPSLARAASERRERRPKSPDRQEERSKPAPKRAKTTPGTKADRSQILDGVVFVLSGFKNPFRAELREKGLALGASYRPDWSRSCTHLISAFQNTPKARQARRTGGHVVTKEWILHAYDRSCRLRESSYSFDSRPRPRYGGMDTSDDDEDEDMADDDDDAENDDDDDDDFDPATAMMDDSDPEYAPPSLAKKKKKTTTTTTTTTKTTPRRTAAPKRGGDGGDTDQEDEAASTTRGGSGDTRAEKPKARAKPKARRPPVQYDDDSDDTDDEIEQLLSKRLRKGKPTATTAAKPTTGATPATKTGAAEDEDAAASLPAATRPGRTTTSAAVYDADTEVDEDVEDDDHEVRDEEAATPPLPSKPGPSEPEAPTTPSAAAAGATATAAATAAASRPRDDATSNGLPELPDFLSGVRIFFYQLDDAKLRKKLSRLVVAYGGRVDNYMAEDTTHVVTTQPWDAAFDDALKDNASLVFVKPAWLHKCHELQAKVDTRPFRIRRSST